MKQLLVMLAIVAVSAMVVSCGPKAKGKRLGKKMAKLENKMDKYKKDLTIAEGKDATDAFQKAYKKLSTKESKKMAQALAQAGQGDVDAAMQTLDAKNGGGDRGDRGGRGGSGEHRGGSGNFRMEMDED